MLFWLAVTLYGALGAVLGSFIGCAIYRLPRGISLSKPSRSFCPGCNRILTAPDLVPVLSYLALRGRARCCGYKLSPWYFVAETGCALIAIYLGLHFGPNPEHIIRWAAGLFV